MELASAANAHKAMLAMLGPGAWVRGAAVGESYYARGAVQHEIVRRLFPRVAMNTRRSVADADADSAGAQAFAVSTCILLFSLFPKAVVLPSFPLSPYCAHHQVPSAARHTNQPREARPFLVLVPASPAPVGDDQSKESMRRRTSSPISPRLSAIKAQPYASIAQGPESPAAVS